ncbi:ANTAR domain-containing response regulator [Geodermatophilus sp. SYSU D00079]
MTVEDVEHADAPPDGATTVREWAQARRASAQTLRRQAAEMRARTVTLRCTVRAQRATVTDAAELRRRLSAAERRVADLEVALTSNRRISQAIGILMARHRLTEDQAFDLLRQCSSHRNVKLAVLAEEVVHTGELPRT